MNRHYFLLVYDMYNHPLFQNVNQMGVRDTCTIRNLFGLVGYKKTTPSGPTILTRLIGGLLVAGTPIPNAFPNGTNGNNINAVPAVPTNFKKSRRDIN